ncbi:hypothetical protein CKM354_001041300 [Cercospora kikuchii]|uniref:DUF7730 domain-containing protein n=1 Tax=Cercospora kikuchii TaxID=84275 RepID=A0A9P3CQZ6_9PEZI|nr:uncharacterized protein CKM354_001041300 [Cercospora kikuchii]GIZ47318.1 hypothetical protein CKM354_001041300 [Cercospora kikuchii]
MSAGAPGGDEPDTGPTATLKFVPTKEPTPLREEVAALIEPWRAFDLPLVKRTYNMHGEVDLKISVSAARAYLCQCLEPPREGTFKFMALPAELREKVYKMLLVYPEPGLSRAEEDYVFPWRLVHPSERLVLESTSWIEQGQYRESVLLLPPMHEALAVLRVSKQIHHEALPVFYGLNKFHFGCLPTLYRGLQDRGEDALKQIRYLHMTMDLYAWEQFWDKKLPSLGRMLDSIVLRKLVFSLPQKKDFEALCQKVVSGTDTASTDLSKLDDVDGLGQFVALAQRAESVEWQGDGIFKTWVVGKLEGVEEVIVSDENVPEPTQHTGTGVRVAPYWSRCLAQAVTAVNQSRFWSVKGSIDKLKTLNRSR